MKAKNLKTIAFLCAILLVSISFISCESSDNNNTNNSNFSSNFGGEINKDFIGRIVDEYSNPISNVAIKIGSSTTLTDVNGMFIINGATVHEKFAFISAKKTGFIDGSRSLVPANGVNNVNIMLLSSVPTSTINSGAASEVSLSSGTKVNFDGAFQDASGAAYTGNVQVTLNELKASNPNIDKIMPGMLYAQAEDNSQKVLETFGMMNVKLTGSNGQELQIASGHTAQITMDIDASQLATAPTTIPLWHFDETNGYWIEDGTATKTGNKYVGNVSHFSWWNCDFPYEQASLIVNTVDNNGNPVNNVRVDIIQTDSLPRFGYSNASGQVTGIIPANESLTLKAYDDCGAELYTSTIGPFAVNSITTLPNIVIPPTSLTSVVGSLKKCDGSNVTNGYLLMNNNNTGNNFTLITNGNFSFNSISCTTGSAFTLQGYDYDAIQTTGVLNFNYVSPITNVGTINACTAVNEFISYQVDSNPVNYIISGINATYNTSPSPINNLGLTISAQDPVASIYLWGNTNVVGSYTTSTFSIEGTQVGYISAQSTNTVVFNLNSFGAVGQYIDMIFNGTYDDATGTHTLTGTVHVIRDN
jgi:hypothetical protein